MRLNVKHVTFSTFHVLPLDALGATRVLARRIAAGAQIDPIAAVLAAAIELGGLLGIQRPGQALGLGESGGCGVQGKGCETAEQG